MGWILKGASIYQHFIALGKRLYFSRESLSYYEVSLWIHAFLWKHSCVLYSCSYGGCSLCELSASFNFWPASVSRPSTCIEGKANHIGPLLSTDIEGEILYAVVLFSTLFYTWAVAKWRVPPWLGETCSSLWSFCLSLSSPLAVVCAPLGINVPTNLCVSLTWCTIWTFCSSQCLGTNKPNRLKKKKASSDDCLIVLKHMLAHLRKKYLPW